MGFRKNKLAIFLLLLVLVVAGIFRLWKLDSVPPGLYPDAAIYGNDAWESLKTGNFKIFYPENNGREGLFMWLLALSFSVFGVSVWSLKLVPALIGILTVLGLYLLTKELFFNNSRSFYLAPLSAFFLAASFWHTNFSRIGFRAILMPLVLVFGFYFLLRGFRRKKFFDFIISGIIFGLGFYTYISYRLIVVLLPLVLALFLFIYYQKKEVKKFLFLVSCLIFFIFITAFPIGYYFLQNPQDFLGRAAPISVFASDNPFRELGKSLILHLGMFNFYGDGNWRHNFAGLPQLPRSLGVLFLIGLIVSIKEIVNLRKHKNLSLVIGHWLLVTWFLIMLLPGILTYEGIPHSLRVIGVIPAVYVFVALGFWWVYEKIKKNTENKRALLATSLIFLSLVSVYEFNKYFFLWGKNKEVEGAFTKIFFEQGKFLNALPESFQKYVIVNEGGVKVPWPNGIPMSAQTIMFVENTKSGKTRAIYLLPEDLEKIKIEKEAVILPMKYEESLFDELKRKFPQGEIKTGNGKIIYYLIKRL